MRKNNIQPNQTSELFDKYDLRVLRIIWFIIGFLTAGATLILTLHFYGKF